MVDRDPIAVLADQSPFADVAADRLRPVLATMSTVRVAAGGTLMRQGDEASGFVVMLDGHAEIVRDDRDGQRIVGRVGPGSIVGELALLRGRPRMADVRATEDVECLIGDVDAFEALLAVPGFADAVARLVAQRLARNTRPVAVVLRSGVEVRLRPILPTDGDAIVSGYEHLSPESRRRRFFSPVRMTGALLQYLVDVDYLDHFAWVATPRDRDDLVVASARYVRARDHPDRAELAVVVGDELQGSGLGRTMIGALGAAAWPGGIRRFTAEVLADNVPMRGLLTALGARWDVPSAGVVEAVVEVDAIRRSMPIGLWAELHRAATDIIATAALALSAPAPP